MSTTETINLIINGKEVTGYSGQTILDVAEANAIRIPTLCYDKRMEIYGSCGLCSVEIEGNPKLIKACATPITEGMTVITDSERVVESRKTNLELLLSKHIGDCVAPCQLACPGETDCQGYVGLIANGEFETALELIKKKIPLPASIGRVCPHPCEKACRRGLIDEPISILWLKRFAADFDMAEEMYMPEMAAATGKSIGIIGGGPGGLSAAYFLRILGHDVTIYEAMPKMGGMLRYGIPEYRLPKNIVDEEVQLIEDMGVTYKNNVRIGVDLSFDAVRQQHDAVFAAPGAWVSSGLRVEGVDAKGVVGGIDLLRCVVNNEPFAIGERVAIVGGGNTAMDACRSAVRLGAKEVYNVYRRTIAEMPAEPDEIEEAQEEGVIFKNLCNPSEILKDDQGRVAGMRLQIMELGEPDASGRRRPVPVEGKEEFLDVDTVILAIGQGIDPAGLDGLELTKYNTIIADENTYTTNMAGVFAGGDAINDGASIAIKAIGDARKATAYIDDYLNGKPVAFEPPYYVKRDDIDEDYFADRQKAERPTMRHLAPEDRRETFAEIVAGYTPEQAMAEGARCLECGCPDYFECELIEYANEYAVKPERLAGENPEIPVEDDHPFIERNPSKCILCGRCVRACEEIVGVSALGLVNRGFDTVVQPAMGAKLADSGCISCGTCVDVCPTGALVERARGSKNVPTDTTKTTTTCGYCGAGCQIVVEAMGDTIVKSTPVHDMHLVNEGVMCGRGRFGTQQVQQGERLLKPLVRNRRGELVEADWYDAFVAVAKGAQSISARYGDASLAVAIAPKYTTEEMTIMKVLAGVLRAKSFSFSNREFGEKTVLGKDFVDAFDMNDLLAADAILTIGCERRDNPVLRYKLAQAAENGASVLAVQSKPEGIEHFGDEFIVSPEDFDLLAEIAKAIIAKKTVTIDGLAELTASLADIEVSEEAEMIAATLCAAKAPTILISDRRITTAAAAMAANIAVLLGSEADFHRIMDRNNEKAMEILGIEKGSEIANEAKGLIIFGEDTEKELDNVEFLVVSDTHLTKTAARANVVLPASAFPEVTGSFINTEGRIEAVKAAVTSPLCYSNIDMVDGILDVLGDSHAKLWGSDLRKEMQEGIPALKDFTYGQVISGGKSQKPKLVAFEAESVLFDEKMPTDYLMNAIEEDLAVVTADIYSC